MPLVQTSLVQGLPSTGSSLSSTLLATMLPLMQMSLRQSPCIGFATTVPSAVLLDPHWPAVSHENVLQAVLVPHSPVFWHWTQAGAVALPLYPVPSFSLQVASAAS